MSYEVRILRPAARALYGLSSAMRERINARLESLIDDPRPRGARKLKGREQYRIRVGNYRVLYTIDDPGKLVTINFVEHRRAAYR